MWGQGLPKKTIRLCSPQVGPTFAQAPNARLFPVLLIRGMFPSYLSAAYTPQELLLGQLLGDPSVIIHESHTGLCYQHTPN